MHAIHPHVHVVAVGEAPLLEGAVLPYLAKGPLTSATALRDRREEDVSDE